MHATLANNCLPIRSGSTKENEFILKTSEENPTWLFKGWTGVSTKEKFRTRTKFKIYDFKHYPKLDVLDECEILLCMS